MGKLAWLVFPLFGIWQGWLHFSDVWPLFGEFCIQSDELGLISRHFVFRIDGIHRALWLAQRAVDALVRVDNEEIRAFIEAVYRTHFHAISVFAVNTVFANYKCHRGFLKFREVKW
jgi:hypothetical protein